MIKQLLNNLTECFTSKILVYLIWKAPIAKANHVIKVMIVFPYVALHHLMNVWTIQVKIFNASVMMQSKAGQSFF